MKSDEVCDEKSKPHFTGEVEKHEYIRLDATGLAVGAARLLVDAGLSPQDWREAYLLYLRFQQDLRLIVFRAQQRASLVGEAQPTAPREGR